MTRLAYITAAVVVTAFAAAIPSTAGAESDTGSPPPAPSGLPPSDSSAPPPAAEVEAVVDNDGLDSSEATKGCTIVGTDGPDVLVGTRKQDVICALDGADLIRARGGNDRIYPGPGRDRIEAGAGDDRILAQDGQRDSIAGGRGHEVASLDLRDRAEGVEVRDGYTARASTPWNGAYIGSGQYMLGTTSCDLGVDNWAYGGGQRGYTQVEWPDAKGYNYTAGVDITYFWTINRWFEWNGSRWVLIDWSDWYWGRGSDTRTPPQWHSPRTGDVFLTTQVSRQYWDPGYYRVAQQIIWVDASGRTVRNVYQWTPHNGGPGYCAL